MGNFDRNNRGGGNKFGKRNFGGRDARPQMHDAVCSKCGRRCQVPFRPTGERPIFCSDCFEREPGGAPQRNEGRERRMYLATCSKCGKKCEVPFLPTSGRPTYCKDCFESGATTIDRRHDDSPREYKNNDSNNGQFAALNAKLDKILNILVSPKKMASETIQPIKTDFVKAEKKPAKIKKAKKK